MLDSPASAVGDESGGGEKASAALRRARRGAEAIASG
jgi:hypothetical protein